MAKCFQLWGKAIKILYHIPILNPDATPYLAGFQSTRLKLIFSMHFGILKLTCRHINRRHICFNIKSISVHPLLWMNVMLDFICMVFAGM